YRAKTRKEIIMETYNIYRDGEKIASDIEEKQYTDKGLDPDTEYEYQVSAEKEGVESALSDKVVVKTEPTTTTTTTEKPTTTSTTTEKPTTTSTTTESEDDGDDDDEDGGDD